MADETYTLKLKGPKPQDWYRGPQRPKAHITHVRLDLGGSTPVDVPVNGELEVTRSQYEAAQKASLPAGYEWDTTASSSASSAGSASASQEAPKSSAATPASASQASSQRETNQPASGEQPAFAFA